MSDLQQVKVLMQNQRWEDAKAMCSQICDTEGKHEAEAWFLLGAAHGQLEEFYEAEACFRQAVALRPDVPVVMFNLGIALQKQGKLNEAILCFRQAISLNPNYAEAHNELGIALQSSGAMQLEEVVECYRRAILLKKTFPVAHYNLACVLTDLERTSEACTHFEEALRQNPNMTSASVAYARLLTEVGDGNQAVTVLKRAIEHEPNNLALRYLLGKAMKNNGQYLEALQVFNALMELKKGDEAASGNCAQIYERMGEYEKGYALLQPYLNDAKDPAVGLAYAALARHVGQQAEAAAVLEKLMQRDDVDSEERQSMNYALGKLYDAMGDYDRAFPCFQRAAAEQKTSCNMAVYKRDFSAIMSVFNAENIRRRPRASNKSRLPIFIVGMPRSGTSLVEQILSSHTEVYGAGELKDLSNIRDALSIYLRASAPYPYCVDAMKQKQLDEIAGGYLAKLAGFSRSAQRVTDKMPHNFLHLGLIDMLFPNACVIHCMRNPLDNCLSIYTQHFRRAHTYAFNLATLGQYYRLYEKMMFHWKQTLRVRILDVQYENLVANQEEESRRLLEFCGLPWEAACLSFHENRRLVRTISYDQVRRPIYRKSVERWKNYERQLGPLIAALNESGQ